MITRDEITLIGKFNKPHGINGEVSATLSIPVEILEKCRCVVCDIDGIFVPFFINSIRSKSNETALLNIDDISNEQEAMMIVNKDIYVLHSDYAELLKDEEELPVDVFANFDAVINGTIHGTISHIDTTTANVLFTVKLDDGTKKLIPAVEEFISSVDINNKTIELEVPQALLEL